MIPPAYSSASCRCLFSHSPKAELDRGASEKGTSEAHQLRPAERTDVTVVNSHGSVPHEEDQHNIMLQQQLGHANSNPN